MGVRKGGQWPLPGFWVKVYLGEHFFSTAASCSKYSCQLPAKKGYFIALVARSFQIFSRLRANRNKNSFCGRRAQRIVDF